MSDNGELKDTVKTEDIVFAVTRVKKDGKEQLYTYLNPENRCQLEVALMRMTHTCYGVFNAMSFDEQAKNKSSILKPNDFTGMKR